MQELHPVFFARETVTVARELLGKIISVNGCSGRIVETEAYGRDPASHAYKRTERSALMFDTFAHVYVYLIYGMYWCLNFTTEKDEAGAVLIRAVEPLTGIISMQKRRGTKELKSLCSGPGKLCSAFGVDKTLNGLPLGKQVKVFDDGYAAGTISTSSRIGITDARHLEWRFFIDGNAYVSR